MPSPGKTGTLEWILVWPAERPTPGAPRRRAPLTSAARSRAHFGPAGPAGRGRPAPFVVRPLPGAVRAPGAPIESPPVRAAAGTGKPRGAAPRVATRPPPPPFHPPRTAGIPG